MNEPDPSPESPQLSGQLRQSFEKTAAAGGTISFVAGFISDVLQPLAPIASYLLVASGVALVVLGLVAAVARAARNWALPMTVFALFMGLFSGAMVALQAAGEGEERGVVAANVPAIASLQETLGLIQQDVAEIKETTVRIEDKTDQVLKSVENISSAFSELANQGGVISDPKTPEQYYHNARLYELKGDYGNARRAYLAYFNFNLEFLDPHLRFQDFLKVQEGRAGARESYQYIANRSTTTGPKVAAILLWDREKRIQDLEAFLNENPDYAPAYYLMSLEFSRDRVGNQSLEDKRREKALLEQFQELDAKGQLAKLFVDKEMVSNWRADAEARLKALESSAIQMEDPVVMTWMHTNSGWMGNIQIVEPTLEIFWKKPGETEFQSTGMSQARSYSTGKFQPNMTISLPNSAEKSEFSIKYVNASGVEMGPYQVGFDPVMATMEQSKQTLRLTRQGWVSFRDWDDKTLLYFSHLLTHRGVLTGIRYGVDKETPDQSFDFPAYEKPGMADISSDVTIYTTVPDATKFVTVQLSFKDGTQSEIATFERE
tara:strand:+ start:1703 stop:3340 length:1638 start_codon:yes stop_codon:yes gene_type:complete